MQLEENKAPYYVRTLFSTTLGILDDVIKGWVFLYCIQSEGLVNNCFLAHCFLEYNKHVTGRHELCPRPQELYNSKHMDMNPTRRDCITYTVPCIP